MTAVAVLVGPPGAGKSTVAALVGQALGAAVRDTDVDVETSAGMSVSEIFVGAGEATFRALEAEAVSAALHSEAAEVIALGGGAVLNADTRRLLVSSGVPVVLLEVGVADAARRVGFNRDRPLLLGNPRQQWVALLAARQAFYDEVATIRVDTNGRPADAVAADVVTALKAADR